MEVQSLIPVAEVVLVPVLTFLTMWIQNSYKKSERQDKREEGLIQGLTTRIGDLEKEVKEVKVELKNRDAEYVKLFQDYTTLKAKHEVLQSDHDLLKKRYDETVEELTAVKDTIHKDRQNTAQLATKTADAIDNNK